MKFKQKKEISIPHVSEHKKLKNSIKLLKYSSYFVITTLALYGAVEFYTTYDFRTPILFQSPVIEKHKTIISPVSKKKVSVVHKAFAAEKPLETQPTAKSYPYQDKITFMSNEQIEVMKQVENTLGQGYAELVFRESGFHPLSVNSIGACGLGQALPCSKLPCELTNIDCQLNWIKNYVENRYQTIEKEQAFHDEKNWY